MKSARRTCTPNIDNLFEVSEIQTTQKAYRSAFKKVDRKFAEAFVNKSSYLH